MTTTQKKQIEAINQFLVSKKASMTKAVQGDFTVWTVKLKNGSEVCIDYSATPSTDPHRISIGDKETNYKNYPAFSKAVKDLKVTARPTNNKTKKIKVYKAVPPEILEATRTFKDTVNAFVKKGSTLKSLCSKLDVDMYKYDHLQAGLVRMNLINSLTGALSRKLRKEEKDGKKWKETFDAIMKVALKETDYKTATTALKNVPVKTKKKS